MTLDELAERMRNWLRKDRGVVLIHGIYPMRDKPTIETCLSVGDAKRTVRKRYKDRDGWWFQIVRNGKEVWSSDHEIAANTQKLPKRSA